MDVHEARRRAEQALLELPNVRGVAVGEREGRPCVVVLVTRKLPEASLAPTERVPREVEGVPTDVLEVGDVRAT